MYNPRQYRLVFEFMGNLEAFIKAIRDEAFTEAGDIAERDLFPAGSSLYGEGFQFYFEDALKKMNCKTASIAECPLAVAAFFRAMAVFASAGRASELNGGEQTS
jgi:hypothetical protein